MKYSITFQDDVQKVLERKYEVEFSVKHKEPITKKDKEKIYKIMRIIDSLGNDSIEETSDGDYRFRSDDDEGEHLLDGITEKI